VGELIDGTGAVTEGVTGDEVGLDAGNDGEVVVPPDGRNGSDSEPDPGVVDDPQAASAAAAAALQAKMAICRNTCPPRAFELLG
jgi:hypothetical protein